MRIRALLGIITGSMLAIGASADGFRNPPEGAAVLGRGGARLTQVNDATAVTHNPANLADVEERQALATATFGYSKTTFTTPTGFAEDSREPWNILPGIYMAQPVRDGDYVVGLGIHVPYGQAKEWARDGVFKFIAPHFAEMKTVDFSPAIARRVNPHLSIGIGVDLMWSDLEFRQQFRLLPPPAGLAGPATELHFKGDGFGVGAHIGATWTGDNGQRIAFSYRSPISIDYEGNFTMEPYPGPGVFPPMITGASDFDTSIDFPTVIALGYGLPVRDRLTLEANVEWVEHSRNRSLDLDIANNNFLLLTAAGTTSLPQAWDDTWTFSLGGDWMLSPEWTLRSGYTYLPTPVPSETLAPSLAEGDKHVIAIGVGYADDGRRLDVAYAYNHADDRTISSAANPIQGTYEFDQHLVLVTYGRDL